MRRGSRGIRSGGRAGSGRYPRRRRGVRSRSRRTGSCSGRSSSRRTSTGSRSSPTSRCRRNGSSASTPTAPATGGGGGWVKMRWARSAPAGPGWAGVAPAALGNRPGECRGRSSARLGGEEAPVGGSRPGLSERVGRVRRGRRSRAGRRSEIARGPRRRRPAAWSQPRDAGRPRPSPGAGTVREGTGTDARISGRVSGRLPLVGRPAGSRHRAEPGDRLSGSTVAAGREKS